MNALPAEKMILFPQLWWILFSLLAVTDEHVYHSALLLCIRYFAAVDFASETIQSVLIAAYGENKGFDGVAPLLFKGVFMTSCESAAYALLGNMMQARCTTIFDPTGHHIAKVVIHLLPWICSTLRASSAEEVKRGRSTADALALYLEAAGEQKLAKVCTKLARASYAKEEIFYAELRKPLLSLVAAAETHVDSILDVLCRLLSYGSASLRPHVFALLRLFLLNVDLAQIQNAEKIVHVISGFLRGAFQVDAELVLDAAAHNLSQQFTPAQFSDVVAQADVMIKELSSAASASRAPGSQSGHASSTVDKVPNAVVPVHRVTPSFDAAIEMMDSLLVNMEAMTPRTRTREELKQLRFQLKAELHEGTM
jgi:hypothetical protein